MRLFLRRAFVTLLCLLAVPTTFAIANYAVTVGSGTTFGSVVVGGIHYAQQFICDLTTPAQCAAVDSSGRLSVKAASGTIASGAMVDLGAQADTVCATATGTCTLIALQKYNNSTNPVLGVGSVVKIDQTTFGTTNGVVSAANNYETVAASQTAQAMGATGATGDYLSHCVVTPGTTSPGVVTILDNSTPIVSFAGGASSVSNLVSFPIPIGAISVSGAWKITTGANVTVVCFGKFT